MICAGRRQNANLAEERKINEKSDQNDIDWTPTMGARCGCAVWGVGGATSCPDARRLSRLLDFLHLFLLLVDVAGCLSLLQASHAALSRRQSLTVAVRTNDGPSGVQGRRQTEAYDDG